MRMTVEDWLGKKKSDLLYRRSENGLINRIYSHQKSNSKGRGHLPPTYTKQELINWLYDKTDFVRLYKYWCEHNYLSNDVPSVDRVDSTKSYTLDNIQLLTWYENNKKGRNEMPKGSNHCKNKTKKYYETFAVIRSGFKTVCFRRGWNFNDFKEIESGFKNKTNKKYYYTEVEIEL